MALSVRQPWAWALIHGGKDVENRTEMAVRNGGMRAQVGKRIAVHASKGMTREEYESARERFLERAPRALRRPGVPLPRRERVHERGR